MAVIASQSGVFKYANTITENWKSNFNTLSKSDFRLSVVSQEITNQLDDYSTKDAFYELNDHSSQFISNVVVQKDYKNDQAYETNELKLLIVELSEKFSDFKEDFSNKNLDTNQSNENNKNSLWKIIVGLVGAFFFVCEFIEHSETAYHLILWLQQTIDILLNHISSK